MFINILKFLFSCLVWLFLLGVGLVFAGLLIMWAELYASKKDLKDPVIIEQQQERKR